MSTDTRIAQRFDDIIKSENDDRLYRGLVLANKMRVMLISDQTTDKSAVALDVNIGNCIIYTLYMSYRYVSYFLFDHLEIKLNCYILL